jgi:isopentenyl diphosphate isomerase/L-lactate dehydrogenase-like FMN-dependent dehydrogenase
VQEARATSAEALVLTVDSPFQVGGTRVARWAHPERSFSDALVETARQWVHVIRGRGRKAATPTKGYGLRARHATSPLALVSELAATAGRPVLVKGILAPEDAEVALEAGAAGIVVSNHGGRVLDGCSASLEMLPSIVQRVAGRIPVLVDSGFRRGSDVLKARALGADAVLVGRPVLWGLGAFGEAGVFRVLEIFTTGLIEAMARCGVRSIREVDARLVRTDFP